MIKDFCDNWSSHLKDIFSNKKVVENIILNYAGSQILRVLLSSFAYSCRSALKSWPKTNLTIMLRKKGFILIPNFLSDEDFKKVKVEFNNKNKAGHHSPIKDGDTFVDRFTYSPNQWKRLPAINKLLSNNLMLNTLKSVELDNVDIGDVWFDTINYGNSQKGASSQTELHSDTFYTTHKVWFFIEPVALEDGPIYFVPSSNQLSLKRLIFEYNKSINYKYLTDYSFRVEPKDRVFFGFEEKALICPSNTLIIANTRGFHRRGQAKVGHFRRQIHFCIRTNNPFSFC